ncbi:glycoside hydrolase family 16 protein [Streptosporangium sp. NPDC004631]
MSIRRTFLGVITAALAFPLLTTPSAASAAPTSAQGAGEWGVPVLTDDFDGTRIDGRSWAVYHSPGAETNPRTRRAVSVGGGMLRLKGGVTGGRDLSGGIASHLSQRYGRWEVRLRAERGAGYTPLALLWPDSQGRPDYAEVDFTEIIDPGRRSSGIFVHRGDRRQAQRQVRADFTRWHTVAVDWLPGRLTFWLDGRKVWDYTGANVPRGHSMHLALQNDVTCNRWSPCRGASTPETVSMYVDWVKIYRARL